MMRGFKQFVALAAVLVVTASTEASNLGHERGGGDDVALKFQMSVYAALDNIKANFPDLQAEIQDHNLAQVARNATYIVVDKSLIVKRNGEQQDSAAANEPATQTIYISRPRWNKITDPHLAEGLALHEVASLAGLESTGRYPISSLYVRNFESNPAPAKPDGKVPFEISSVDGASAWVGGRSSAILGSLAGAPVPVIEDNCQLTAPTCPTAPLCSCSNRRVSDSQVLTIFFTQKVPTKKNLVVRAASGPAVGMTVPLLSNSNRGAFVDFAWGQICHLMTGLVSCEHLNKSAGINLEIGLDENNDGILNANEQRIETVIGVSKPGPDFDSMGSPGNSGEGISTFTPYPGLGSVFIQDLQTSPAFPILSYGGRARSVRVFVSSHSMLDAHPGKADFTQDLEISANGDSLLRTRIDGLKRGRLYFFRIALVDEAGSTVQFYPSMESLSAECTTAPSAACAFSAVPN